MILNFRTKVLRTEETKKPKTKSNNRNQESFINPSCRHRKDKITDDDCACNFGIDSRTTNYDISLNPL